MLIFYRISLNYCRFNNYKAAKAVVICPVQNDRNVSFLEYSSRLRVADIEVSLLWEKVPKSDWNSLVFLCSSDVDLIHKAIAYCMT